MDLQRINATEQLANVFASRELVDTNAINVQEDIWARLHIVHHVASALITGMTF